MVDLHAPVWQTLTSAGNDADKWLRCLMNGEGDLYETIEILAENLSHQLSYYSATAYVLPHLAALCQRLSDKEQVFLIAQIGAAIAAEADCPLSPGTEAFREFEEGLTRLRPQVRRLATAPGIADLLRKEPEIGQQFALSALAILGDRKHAFAIYLMSGSCWEEAAAACCCGWNDETCCFAEEPDFLEPVTVDDWDAASFSAEAVWFQGLLTLAGDEEISPILPYVYGSGICPECGRREPYWTWFDRFYQDC